MQGKARGAKAMTDTTHLRKLAEAYIEARAPEAGFASFKEAGKDFHAELGPEFVVGLLDTVDRLTAELAEEKTRSLNRLLEIQRKDEQIDRITADRNTFYELMQNQLAAHLDRFTENEKLTAERDALAKDAARLDWLCANLVEGVALDIGELDPENLRAQIDAAMKEKS